MKKYSFKKISMFENALNFSKRSKYIRETMLERIYPARIILPMKQGYGEEAIPVVDVGESVVIGQLIGKAVMGKVSSNVHSGISGRVSKIDKITLPNGVITTAVYIDSDRKRTQSDTIKARNDYGLSATESLRIIKESGIVGMGGEGIPTYAKILRAKKLGVQELLVNCLQSEPFATCDLYRLSDSTDSVVRGALVVASILEIKRIRFLVASHRKAEMELMRNAFDRVRADFIDFDSILFEIVPFVDKYPQGYYRMVAKALYKKELKFGELLEQECQALLFNCSTCAAIWDAISEGMPLMQRIVTITSDTANGHNVIAPIGTPISDIINRESQIMSAYRVVWGNALTGLTCNDMDTPIIKTTSAVTIIKLNESPTTPCVHCGKCYDACPMEINPAIACRLIQIGNYEKAMVENVHKCFACGACSYVCPAGIDLTGVIATFASKNRKELGIVTTNAYAWVADASLEACEAVENNIGSSASSEEFVAAAATSNGQNDVENDMDDENIKLSMKQAEEKGEIYIPFVGGKNI